MTLVLLDALKALHVGNDSHWTAEGQPRLDTLKMLVSNPGLTREMVDKVAPGLSRINATDYVYPAAALAAAVAPVVAPAATPTAATVTPAVAPLVQAQQSEDPTFSNHQTKPTKVEGGSTNASDEITSLEEELAEAQKDVQEINRALESVMKEKSIREKRVDGLSAKIDKLIPKNNKALAIQDYFKGQDKVLSLRGDRMSAIRSSGVNLTELLKSLKSPIDASKARKTGR